MNRRSLGQVLLVFALAAAGLAVGCSRPINPDGKYRVPGGEEVVLDLKDGKARFKLGPVQFDGTYKVDGDKVVIRIDAASEPELSKSSMVLAINNDGTLSTPEGGPREPGRDPVRYVRMDTGRWWEIWK